MNYDKPPAGPGQDVNPKLVGFIKEQQAQLQLLESIEKVSETCWDLCDIPMKDKIDGRSETCLKNCLQRYFDVADFIGQRAMQKIQQAGGSMR